MNKIWIIARMTFREAIRRRIVLTGLILGFLFLIIFSIGFHMIYKELIREATAANRGNMQDAINHIAQAEASGFLLLAGLYAAAFLCVAMGALLSADTLAGEINSGTIQTIVTKPLRRADVVLGKWLGFAGLLGLYFLLMAGGVVLSVTVQSGYVPRNILPGLSLIYLESLLIMTVALACSSAMPGLATGGVVFGLYGLAFLGGWIEQIGSLLSNQTAVKVGIVTSLIIPTEALWRRAAYEMQSPVMATLRETPFSSVSVPSTLMILYAVAYLIVSLGVAVNVFQHRDI